MKIIRNTMEMLCKSLWKLSKSKFCLVELSGNFFPNIFDPWLVECMVGGIHGHRGLTILHTFSFSLKSLAALPSWLVLLSLGTEKAGVLWRKLSQTHTPTSTHHPAPGPTGSAIPPVTGDGLYHEETASFPSYTIKFPYAFPISMQIPVSFPPLQNPD